MPATAISYLWRDPRVTQGHATGVSLHSHTNQSQETLSFVADWTAQYGFVRPLMQHLDRRSWDRHRIRIDWARSYWTPPLTPKQAWDLESGQIEKLGLRPMALMLNLLLDVNIGASRKKQHQCVSTHYTRVPVPGSRATKNRHLAA